MDKSDSNPKRLKTSQSPHAEKKDESFEQYIDEYVLADFENDEFLSDPVAAPTLLQELKENDPFGDDDIDDEIFLMVDTEELLAQIELKKLTWKVFNNSLIWRKIMENLNFQDQKNIRLVCKTFNDNLFSETHFLNRTIVHITPIRAQEKHFGATPEFYKHFVIDSWCLRRENFPETTSTSNWFYRKLIDAETITLKATNPDSSIFQKVIQRIIKAPTNLKQLAIDGSLLQFPSRTKYAYKSITKDALEMTISEKFKSNMKNLLEFQILGFRSIDISHRDFVSVMALLSGLLTNLEVIKIEDSIKGVTFPLPGNLASFLQMIEDNRKKLTTLKLDSTFLCKNFTGSVIEKSFPALHTIQIRMENSNGGGDVIKFFKELPMLEDIDLTILNSFDNNILKTISQRSERLKRLRIKTHAFQGLDDNMWKFLSNLEYLEDFELIFPAHRNPDILHNCSLVHILDNLRDPIKKISIFGLPSSTTTLTGEEFKNINPSHIRELNLVNCRNAVNDVTLRFICQNFKLLRKLDVSGTACTDYGFTGIDTYGNSSEFSLTALKGLTELRMRSCGRITNETLIKAIQFLELKYLDVCENHRITSVGFDAVLRNNPSLQLIKTLRSTITYNLGQTENYHEGKRTWINAVISSLCPRFKGFSFGGEILDKDSFTREEIHFGYLYQPNPYPVFFVGDDDDDGEDDGEDDDGGYYQAYDDGAGRNDFEEENSGEESDSGNDSDDSSDNQEDPDWHPDNNEVNEDVEVGHVNNNNNPVQHVPYEPNYDSGPDTPEEDPDWDPNNDSTDEDSEIVVDDESSDSEDDDDDE